MLTRASEARVDRAGEIALRHTLGLEKASVGEHSVKADILGGNYQGHHANDAYPKITITAGAEKNPLLKGVSPLFTSQGSLYKVSPLASSATPILTGTIDKFAPEPVAWTNTAGKSRVFYTSLGHPDDFEQPGFRQLMVNAVFWALDRQAP